MNDPVLREFREWLLLFPAEHEFSRHPLQVYVTSALDGRWFVPLHAYVLHPELYRRLKLTKAAGVEWTCMNVLLEVQDLEWA